MAPAIPVPPAPFPVLLENCLAEAVQAQQTDRIEVWWDLQWMGLPRAVRAAYAVATPAQQTQHLAGLRASAGPWGEWMIARLAASEPFLGWPLWQAEARLAPGPAVGHNE